MAKLLSHLESGTDAKFVEGGITDLVRGSSGGVLAGHNRAIDNTRR